MKSKKKSFLNDSLTYGLSSMLSLGVGILLIPLYTNALPTADFGLYEILNMVSNVLFIFIYMGTINSFVRFYFDKTDDSWKQEVTATSLVFNILSFCAMAMIVVLLRDWFVLDIIEDERAYQYLDLMLIWMFCEMLYRVGTTYLQINRMAGFYLAAHILRAVLFVSLCFYFLLARDRGIDGILTANILACGIFGVGFVIFSIYWTRLKISLKLMGQLLEYGLPYLPAALFILVVTTSDRFFLNEYHGLSEVGIYAMAVKIGLISSMFLSQAFGKVWGPFVFDNYRHDDGPQMIGSIYENFSKLLIATAFCLALIGPIIVPLISAPEYHRAGGLIPLVCLGAIVQGMSMFADTGMLIAKKTKYKIIVGLYGALAALTANLLLTPKFGMVGASLSYTAGVMAILIGNVHYGSRYYRLPINWIALVKGVGLGAFIYLLYASSIQIITTDSVLFKALLQCAFAALALIAFLGVALITGLVSIVDFFNLFGQVAEAARLTKKTSIPGKRRFLAQVLLGRYSPFAYLLPRHRFLFPAIITYHRVFAIPSDYPMTTSVINATPEAFEEHLVYLKKHYNLINFRIMDRLLKSGQPIPRNSLIITFDDGYFDNHKYALPLMVKHQATATVFISTGFIDSGQPFWVDKLAYQIFTTRPLQLRLQNNTHTFDIQEDNRNDVRVAIGRLCGQVSPTEHQNILNEISEQTGITEIDPEYAKLCRPMTWTEVKELDAAGIEIGAHSIKHGFLIQHDPHELEQELVEPKRRIEEKLGKTVISMAYPSGVYNKEVIDAAKAAGYQYCCTFNNGFDGEVGDVDFHQLSRIVIGNHMPMTLFSAQLKLPRLFIKP